MMWDRRSLSDKGVFYDEEIRRISIPYALDPPHVEVLRTSMLDFSCSIISVDDRGDTPTKSSLDEAASSWRQHTDPIVRQTYEAREEAMRLHKGGYPETSWAQFFRRCFFEPLEQATSKTSGNVRRASRNNYYYDGFKTAGETESWTFFDGRKDKNDTSALLTYEREKCPKPDYACFLPIYHLDADPKIPQAYSSEGRNWHQSSNHALVEQFSWTLLKKLRSYGLEPTPFKIFHAKPRESSLKCYPWLIVEHKKESNESDEHSLREAVYCQATNAAACAIQLNVQAAKYAIKSAECAQVPPIPVITTIGPKVKVWIMYQAQDFYGPTAHRYYARKIVRRSCKEGFIMRAIWEGDVTNIEDTAKLQIILENTHTWAMRIFRPLISSYIDTWKCVHLENNAEALDPQVRRTETITRNGTVRSTIQGFLKDLDPANLVQNEGGNTSPLLLGMLFHVISNAERRSLVEELTGIIDARISGLTVRTETAASQQHTAHQQSQDFHENLSSVFSRLTTADNDDPRDSDYADSQASQSQSSDVHFRHQPDRQSPARSDTGISETAPQNQTSQLPENRRETTEKTTNQPGTSRLSPIPLYTRTSPIPSVENVFSPQTIASISPLNAGSAVSTKPSSVSELQDTPTPKVQVPHSSFSFRSSVSSSTPSPSPLRQERDTSHMPQIRTNSAEEQSTDKATPINLEHAPSATPSRSPDIDRGESTAPGISLGTPMLSSTRPKSPSGSLFSPSPEPMSSQSIFNLSIPPPFNNKSTMFGYHSRDSSVDRTGDLDSAKAADVKKENQDDA